MPRGRKPKPTKLKLLEGNPGKRRINEREPKPPAKVPTCPGHLDREAKREWRRMAKLLHGMGLLTQVDRAALAAYCACYSRWAEAERDVQEKGTTSIAVARNGTEYPVQNPKLVIARNAMRDMLKFMVEFGLTPSSRSRVTVDAPEDADGVEAFARKRKGA